MAAPRRANGVLVRVRSMDGCINELQVGVRPFPCSQTLSLDLLWEDRYSFVCRMTASRGIDCSLALRVRVKARISRDPVSTRET